MVTDMKKSILGVGFVFFVFMVLGLAAATNPAPVQGTNPVSYYNSSSSSVTFDMKCSNKTNPVSAIQLWADVNGTWAANYSNASYTNDTWLNITVPGILEGQSYNWSVWCNDSANNTNITANRTFSVDSTIPLAVQGTNPTDGYNSVSSSTNATFDIQCSDNVAVSMIQLWTNTTGTWKANYTNSSYTNNTWLNVTVAGIPDGQNYKWAVWCNDTSGLTSLTNNRTLLVNVPTPSQGTNPVDNSYDVDGSVTFDMGCSDSTNISMIQLWTNTTGTWAVNSSNGSYINNTLFSVTVAGIPEAQNYKWAVWCNSTAGPSSITANRTFNVDKTAPSVTQISPQDYDTSSDARPEFHFKATDNVGATTCTLYINGVSRGTKSNPENGTDVYITPSAPSLSDGVTYPWYVKCSDAAGNVGTSDTWHVDIELSGSGSGGGSDNSNTDVTAIDTTSAAATARLAGDILQGDKTITGLVLGNQVNFTVGSVPHHLIITDVTSNYTVIDISSTPITATINAGQTKTFDLDGNGKDDFAITVQGISALKKINLILKSVNESASNVTNVTANLTATSAPKAAKTRAAFSISIFKNIKWGSVGKFFKKFWWIVVIIVVVIAAIVLLIVFRKSMFGSGRRYWWKKGAKVRLK